MAMRMDVDFPRPLSREQRTAMLLALAALPKTSRVKLVRGGHGIVIMGEALGLDRVRSALEDEGLVIEAIRTSLAAEEDLLVDEVSDAHPAGKERLRPIGR
ncbi:MAG: hypothetical protein EA402_01895 [Planctomycetota bacterium]|nr:MAG: hypothetical protein EA402_01895 [Planctomycetota bacterium]